MNSVKILFVFFGLFSLAFSEIQEINFAGEGQTIPGEANENITYHVTFQSGTEYEEYFSFTLEKKKDLNPTILVSTTDSQCDKDRLFVGVQSIDKIYIFVKKEQIKNNEIFICLKAKESPYELKLANEDSAFIPFNSQASYYISDQNTENMKFTFIKPEDETISSDSKVTIWLRGNYIEKPSLASFAEETFDSAYVYYGSYSENLELEVNSKAGDYITIGSTVISDKKTHELKENANEIMVASEEEVCLPIVFESTHLSHITGKIFTRKADAHFKDESGNLIDDKDYVVSSITNGILDAINGIGIIEEQYMNQKGFFCLKSSVENKPLIFAIQLTYNKEIYQPLYSGEFRRHFLMKNEIAVFYGMEPKDGATEVNFNLKAIKGFPYMYYDGCTTFPDCTYTEQSIKDKNLIQPYPSNRISVYSFYLNNNPEYKKFNPFGKFQPLMVVHCGDGYNKEEFMGDDSFCVFETAIFTNKDTINIYEESSFSQYLLSGEEDDFKISLIGDDNLDKIYLDMLIFSGDASLELDNFSGIANKYYLSNKIFYSIHLDDYNENSLNFKVKATNATFYMVNYQLIKKDNTDDANTIESGVNYITSKYEEKDSEKLVKRLDFTNYGVDFNQSYLISLFSPNCLFDVDWVHSSDNKERITTFNNTSQYIIKPTDPDYEKGKYSFEYDIQFDDMTEYSKKFCMVYASGIELTSGSADNWNGRAISLSEGVPHRYTYTKDYPVMFYAYHMSDYSKTLVLNFNLIDKDYFNITLKVGKQFLRAETIYRNTQLYITSKDVEEKCEEEEVCTIIVIVSLFNLKKIKTVELTAYQIDLNPFYLEKNAIKQDIIHGNKYKYYYFDIGKGEYGDITLDVKRGSGNIYATVVERNLQTPMDDPQWRGKYHFPTTVDESLIYDKYSKKIYITENSTEKCEDGCYVLISIVSSLQYYGQYEDETTPYRISINTRIYNQDTYIGNPKVRMQVNDFVIGNIDFSKKRKDRIDYYMVTLPYDSPYILIDWQADLCSFMINVGTNRPHNDSHHFIYHTIGHDYVYRINSEDIIKYSDDKETKTTKGITLTIGIFSHHPDTMDSSPYAFKIFMPPTIDKEYELAAEIIHIRSDQKVQCLPFEYNTTNICVFAVVFDEMDYNHNLVLYPRSGASKLTIRGNLVDAERVERNDPYEIMKVMGEINTNGSSIVNKKYVYINKIPKHQTYVFIVNEFEHLNTIEVLSSTLELYDGISIFPNPSTAQIFAMQDYTANINFETSKDLLINLVSLSGEGCFYWGDVPEGQEKKYYLNGYEDRLTLTSNTSSLEEKLSALIAKPLSPLENNPEGFIFYITYYPRTFLDQLKEDRNTEIHYRKVFMPLNYYIPINNINSYLISINFYDFAMENTNKYTYESQLFKIWATIITNETVVRARYIHRHGHHGHHDFPPDASDHPEPSDHPAPPRRREDFLPQFDPSNCVPGVYDSSFGALYFSSERINQLKKDDNPYLYLRIDPADNVPHFLSMGLEITVHSDYITKGYGFVPEEVYFNGKLHYKQSKEAIYSLRTDSTKHYMRIEFSANSDKVNYILVTNTSLEESDVQFNNMTEYGRQIIDIDTKDYKQIYLKIFSKEQAIYQLDNYVFKYSLANAVSSFYSPHIKNNADLTVTKDNNNLYKVVFNSVDEEEASYYIKAVYKQTHVHGENLTSIAISESNGMHLQADEHDSNLRSYEFIPNGEISYVRVIAKVKREYTTYFLSYNVKDCSDLKPDNSGSSPSDNDNSTLIISISVVGAVLVIIIIVLIIFVITYNKKNKDLLKQVNKVSFVESGSVQKEDDNLLLGSSSEQ